MTRDDKNMTQAAAALPPGQCGCQGFEKAFIVTSERPAFAPAMAELGYTVRTTDKVGKRKLVQNSIATTLVFANGTELLIPAGTPIKMSVRDWLAAADDELSLDKRCFSCKPSPADNTSFPFYRVSGVHLVCGVRLVSPTDGPVIVALMLRPPLW